MVFFMFLNIHSEYFSEQRKFAVFVMEKGCDFCSVIANL
jgi:hypothetical protein